ncbi:MAG: VanZ family protein [Microbacterium sp.]
MPAPRLPRTSGVRHVIVGVLAVVYGSFLAVVAFWPSPVDRPVASLLERAIDELHERGVPSFVDYGFLESSANIALFVPVGLLLGLALPVRWWPGAVVLGPLLSMAIELAQGLFLSARYASWGDVLANSVGATIGVLLALTLRAVVALRDERVVARHEALARALAEGGRRRPY